MRVRYPQLCNWSQDLQIFVPGLDEVLVACDSTGNLNMVQDFVTVGCYLFAVGSKDGSIGPGGFGRSDGEGDDRLAHILNEASHMMKTPTGPPHNDDSRSNEDSSSPRTQCLSPFSKVRMFFKIIAWVSTYSRPSRVGTMVVLSSIGTYYRINQTLNHVDW